MHKLIREVRGDNQSYWREVKRIAEMAVRDAAEGGDVYVHADEYVQDNPWLNHPQKVVEYSKNPDAFHEWDPEDVVEGSDTWWRKRAFYAMAQDVYDLAGADRR